MPLFVKGYNTRVHRFAPVNQEQVWHAFYPEPTNEQEKRVAKEASHLRLGDYVRITKAKGTFVKGYIQNWTREVFVMLGRQVKMPRMTYELKDLAGEDITGTFVAEQLQKVNKPETFLSSGQKRIKKAKKNSWSSGLAIPNL